LNRKNDYLEQFLYTTSHDMRTPLVTVKTFLGFLENDIATGNKEQLNQDLKYIHQATDKMKLLLDRLLDLSRVDLVRSPPTKLALSAIIAEVTEALAGLIESKRAEIIVSDVDITLNGSRERLCAIWQNLIENAIAYCRDDRVPTVKLDVRQSGGETVFSVRDNGIGIDPRYLDRIFMMFEKLKPESPGAGLGLSMTKYVVENEGGRIWAESAGDGTGTCISFTLPKANAV
jgi:signal transduction histidine kinase